MKRTVLLFVSLAVLQACGERESQEQPNSVSLEIVVDPRGGPLPFDGGLSGGQLALTFDDGPDPDTTRRILSVLKKHRVLATFFQVGIHVDAHPEITREILAGGHSVGSHTWDHPDLAQLPLEEALENIARGLAAVERAAGSGFHNPFFRFPQFSSSEELSEAVQDAGLIAFHANIITEDWLTPDPAELLAKSLVAVEAEGHGIVLFHDIQPQTAEMLDAFLTEISARGYQTVVFRPEPTLASLAAAHGIRIGSLSASPADERSGQIARREFNIATMPAFFRVVRPGENSFDFTLPDRSVALSAPSTVIRGHNLIWCEALPDWLTQGDYTGPELQAILVQHVTTVLAHYRMQYPGKVIAWDVINEPLSYQGDSCPWNRIGLEAGLGELEYVRIALHAARAADPDAKLYVNDFFIEGDGDKLEAMLALVEELKNDNVPIDGVGLQSHFRIGPGELFREVPLVDEIVHNMNRFAALGLETAITEADLSISDAALSLVTLDEQAQRYAHLIRACLSADRCVAFVTWGVGDKESWIPDFFPGWGNGLLFDSDYLPKPAYYAVKAELSKRAAYDSR